MHSCVPRQCRHKRVANPDSRPAFTLLEVIVGTVLLASLVSGVVVATGAHQRKLLFARQKAVAVQAADEILNAWNRSPSGIPLSAAGAFVNSALQWQTQVVESRLLCEVPVHVVRLSIYRSSQDKPATKLCYVDVVVDAMQPDARRSP